MDTTQHDLKILSICYYIMAGIALAYLLLFGAYMTFFAAIFANVPMHDATGKGLPEFVPRLVAAVGAAVLGIGLLSTALMAGAGWSLPKRRNYSLVMTAAVLNCLQIPFGTALSVFTFLVLNRPGVRESFRMGYPVRPVDPSAPPSLPPAW